MVRQIVSQDPIVRPAEAEKTFGDVKMKTFKAVYDGTKTRLHVLMQPYDFSTGELLTAETPYILKMKDMESQIGTSPKFEAAWDTINDVMGLAYDFFRLKEKVKEAIANEEDPSALIILRDAALAALQAPV